MTIKRMPINLFVEELRACVDRKDGYIMGAKGQDPKGWKESSWWFTQYSGDQKKKALYWRENASFVWDCNGLAEGIYEKWSGVNINTKARYNYSGWCGEKGTGMIPSGKRDSGVAVFWGKKASDITHVAYLDRPVNAADPDGDWYIIEARGVMYGCVRTLLSERKPNFWGIMDKYFDYGVEIAPAVPELGEVALKKGMADREDVKQMQLNLLKLGYDLGKYGADGDFGSKTEEALMAFQMDKGLYATGEYDSDTHVVMMSALEVPAMGAAEPVDDLTVTDGTWRIRTGPGTAYPTAGFVYGGDKLTKIDMGSWRTVMHNGEVRFISGSAVKEG